MWPSLWVSASLISLIAWGAPSHLGSASSEEANLIWQRAQASFQSEHFSEAIAPLKRLVDRYPGHPGFLEAHRLLGISYLKTGKPGEALKPLRYFAEAARGGSADQSRETQLTAKALVVRANLALEKWNEALLLSEEVRKKTSQPLLKAEAQILKAHALIGLDKDLEAAGATDDSLTFLSKDSSKILLAEARSLLLRLLGRRCSRLPSQGGMDEAQARDQLERRSICQQDTLRLLKEVSDLSIAPELDVATELTVQGYADFANRCINPPDPIKLSKGKRTDEQKHAYRADLQKLLFPICLEAIDRAIETVQEWKLPTAPALVSNLERQKARIQGNR